MPKLSVTVITLNEAAHIGAALETVAWADEIIVVDSHSTDATVGIAQRFTDRVIARDWLGYAEQKNYAASLARNDWILSIDADERVTADLGREVRDLLATEPPARGYRIPRITYHLGRWVKSTDWFPDHQLRLYDRRAGRWLGPYVHESVRVDGPVGLLRHQLEHYAYRDIAHHLQTIDRYSSLAARQMYEAGRRTNVFGLVAHPPLAFLRNYIARRGFRDGAAGLVVSMFNSYYVLAKMAKLWELQRKHKSEL